ncbi:MAG: hypothetical protein K0R94_1392 [Burkholderiales bacterium]|jgi:diadenosine tetraphosphate (Ap4A) HIT family hydrolase|nr:hypothetical protein [Burkholderiales bacterium]
MLIYESKYWQLKHRQDSKLPGYLILAAKETKSSSLADLSHESLTELGTLQAEISRILEQYLNAKLVYICRFGHQPGNPPHFHIVPLYDWVQDAYSRDPLWKDQEPDGPVYFTYITRAFIEYLHAPTIIGPSIPHVITIIKNNFNPERY